MGLESELNDSARGSTSSRDGGGLTGVGGYGGYGGYGPDDDFSKGTYSAPDFSSQGGRGGDSGPGAGQGDNYGYGSETLSTPETTLDHRDPAPNAPEPEGLLKSKEDFYYGPGPGVNGWGTPIAPREEEKATVWDRLMSAEKGYTAEDFGEDGHFTFLDKEMASDMIESFNTPADYLMSLDQSKMFTPEEAKQIADKENIGFVDRFKSNKVNIYNQLGTGGQVGLMVFETLSGIPIHLALDVIIAGKTLAGDVFMGQYEALPYDAENLENPGSGDAHFKDDLIAGLVTGIVDQQTADTIRSTINASSLGSLPSQQTASFGRGLLRGDGIITNVNKALSEKDRGYKPYSKGD